MTRDNPIIAQTQECRCELSEQFGTDVHADYDNLCELQAQYQSQVVSQIAIVPWTGNIEREQ